MQATVKRDPSRFAAPRLFFVSLQRYHAIQQMRQLHYFKTLPASSSLIALLSDDSILMDK